MIKYNNDFIPKEIGLVNNGSVCYFNSLLQSLISCSSFNQLMLETDSSLFKPLILSTDLFSGLNILEFLKQKNIKETKNSRFGLSQEDVGESFHLLIDAIPECSNLFKSRYRSSIFCKNCKDVISTNVDNIFVIDIQSDIKQPLNTYIKEFQTVLTNYNCPKCNSSNVYKIYQLCKLSSIIVIQFNKFYEKKNIDYPPTLEFNHSSGNKIQYRLVSRIEHFGSMRSGHYTADSLRDTIIKFNDSSVSTGSFAPTENTYYLFYHLI